MLQPHVLGSVSEPRQRLGITENALVFPAAAAAVLFVFEGIVTAMMGWVLVHGIVFMVCRMEPHFVQVWKARHFYGRTIRGKTGGGNRYGA